MREREVKLAAARMMRSKRGKTKLSRIRLLCGVRDSVRIVPATKLGLRDPIWSRGLLEKADLSEKTRKCQTTSGLKHVKTAKK